MNIYYTDKDLEYIEELEKDNYNNFHNMVKCVLDTYGKEYLLKLAAFDEQVMKMKMLFLKKYMICIIIKKMTRLKK